MTEHEIIHEWESFELATRNIKVLHLNVRATKGLRRHALNGQIALSL